MLKKMISASVVILALMLSGCGTADSEGESMLAAQNAVDTGDAGTAIAILEAKTDRTDDENALLAEAYASQAGYSMIDITIAFVDASESNVSSNSTVSLIESLIDQASPTAVADLNQSIAYYESIPVADRTEDQNFKLGMTYIVLLAVMVDDPSYAGADILPIAQGGFDALGAVVATMNDPDLQTSYDELELEMIGVDDATSIAKLDDIIAQYNALP